jgi:hypothetical protein
MTLASDFGDSRVYKSVYRTHTEAPFQDRKRALTC